MAQAKGLLKSTLPLTMLTTHLRAWIIEYEAAIPFAITKKLFKRKKNPENGQEQDHVFSPKMKIKTLVHQKEQEQE